MALSSDIVSYVTAGYVFEKLGAKASLASCYAVSSIGGIVMLTYGL